LAAPSKAAYDSDTFLKVAKSLESSLNSIIELYNRSRDEGLRDWLDRFLYLKSSEVHYLVVPHAAIIAATLNSAYLEQSALGSQMRKFQKPPGVILWPECLRFYVDLFTYLILLDKAQNPDRSSVEQSRSIREQMIKDLKEDEERISGECREILQKVAGG
jgi:hypothetical protein